MTNDTKVLLNNTTGNNNTAIGYQALTSYAGSQSTAIGTNALRDTSGISNFAIGYQAGRRITTGIGNLAIDRSLINVHLSLNA